MATRATALALLIAAVLAFSAPAYAHLAYPMHWHSKSVAVRLKYAKLNLAHVKYLVAHGHGPWVAVHRRAIPWLKRVIAKDQTRVHPAFGRWAVDSCTASIIDKEDPSWNPRQWNTSGSGAYGLGQALPPSKMAPFGADYMTNPWTQLKWMVAYETARYGSPCGALSYWGLHSSY